AFFPLPLPFLYGYFHSYCLFASLYKLPYLVFQHACCLKYISGCERNYDAYITDKQRRISFVPFSYVKSLLQNLVIDCFSNHRHSCRQFYKGIVLLPHIFIPKNSSKSFIICTTNSAFRCASSCLMLPLRILIVLFVAIIC
ncbi:hypothetical protein Tcan_07616, partial [Toxocara canis]